MFHRIFYYYKEVIIKFIHTEQNGLLIHRTKCAMIDIYMGKSGKNDRRNKKMKKNSKFKKYVAVLAAGAMILTSFNMPFAQTESKAAGYGISSPRVEKRCGDFR